MKKKPKIQYKGYEWTVETIGRWSVLLERQGKERTIQALMLIEEYNQQPVAKPEPKYDTNKESRLMYGNRAETEWTTLKEVMKKRQHLLKKNEYQESKFIIEQR